MFCTVSWVRNVHCSSLSSLFTVMAAAAATIQMESPGSAGKPAQDQSNPDVSGDNSPHSYPHRPSRQGWWGRQWRPVPPLAQTADPQPATDLPEARQQQQEDGQSSEIAKQADWPCRHGGPRFWHPDRGVRGGEVITDGKNHEYGENGRPHFWHPNMEERWGEVVTDGKSHVYGDLSPYGMAGYHGHRYPYFMQRRLQRGYENTYIFREFDFVWHDHVPFGSEPQWHENSACVQSTSH